MTILYNPKDASAEAANLIISKFPYTWAYFCQFRFALAVFQRVLMRNIQIQAPSLEIGMNDGSSATIAHFGKPKFSYGADMPEENTYESMGLHVDPNFDVYERAGSGCLNSAPRKLSGFLPGYAECGVLRL